MKYYGIGYISDGMFSPTINGKSSKCYNSWKDMLKRCYSEIFHKSRPTYKNCDVCKEWHDFQNFAKWWNENYYEIDDMKMELDKDILNKGNKTYSPIACVYVPSKLNSLFVNAKASRGELPIGVYYHKKNKKYIARLRKNAMGENISRFYIGSFDTSIEAFEAYKNNKEQYVREVAEFYIDIIPEKLYMAMKKYKIELED